MSAQERRGGWTVLLVDTDPDTLVLARDALREPDDGPCAVRTADTLAAAVAALDEGDYGCVLAALALPDADGTGVIETLARVAGGAAVVALAGRGQSRFGGEALHRGADDYLVKGEVSPPQLRRVVVSAMHRKALLRERRASRVLEALGTGVLVLDRCARVESVNPAAAALLDRPAAGMIGRRLPEMSLTFLRRDGTELPAAQCPSVRALGGEVPAATRDLGIRLPDGSVRWLDVFAYPLAAADARPDGVALTLRDVGARRAGQAAQRFSDALLTAVGQAVIVVDPQRRVRFWNPAAERLYGWRAGDVIGRRVADVIAEEAGKVGEGPHTRQVWRRRRDGSSFPALVTDAPVYDDAGHLAAVISVSTDVSGQREAERTAAALSGIVATTADAIYTVSVAGIVESWNGGAERLLGYAAEDVIGQPARLFETRAERDQSALLAAAAAGEVVVNLETVLRHRDGGMVDVALTVSPVRIADEAVATVSVIARDISERRRLEAQLRHQALYDPLTGLPNRALLTDRLEKALTAAQPTGAPVSVLFCDLDHFKRVNDLGGHHLGDEVLVDLAARLAAVIGPADTLARFGDDEFVLVCVDTDARGAQDVAARLRSCLAAPVELEGRAHRMSMSVGIAVAPPLPRDAATLLRHADTAMYAAKADGRARWQVFDPRDAERYQDHLHLTDELREALRAGQLQVHYQPQVQLGGGEVNGVEALLRWRHPQRGDVPPTTFVGLAEQAGFVTEFDDYVLARACQDVAELRRAGLLPGAARLAVNRSARNLGDGALLSAAVDAAERAGLPLAALEIEVTETGLLANVGAATAELAQLRALGVGVALDDFGTGYSSLTYVRQLPVSTLKVDRSFVQHVATRPDDLAVVTSVIDLGRALRLHTVAEGVETTEQLELLHRLGCAAGQGFLWAPALPVRELTSLLGDPQRRFAGASGAPGRFSRRPRRPPVTNEHGLRLMLDLHREGASLTTVAAALNTAGYRSPAGLRWHARSVARAVAEVVAPG